MAHPSDQRLCSAGIPRSIFVLLGVLFVFYITGRPLFRHSQRNAAIQTSCPSCDCDCSSESIFPTSVGDFDSALADCGKDNPEMNREMKKDIITLLSEEIIVQKNVTNDSLEHTKALIMDARKTSSHYQKEAEKCTVGVETCEEAREKAEASLVVERKLSELWEKRAREHGWKDQRRV